MLRENKKIITARNHKIPTSSEPKISYFWRLLKYHKGEYSYILRRLIRR